MKRNPDAELDARQLEAPLPVLRARHQLNGLRSGQLLLIRVNDPEIVRDFLDFCRLTGHGLYSHQENDGSVELVLSKR